MADASVSTPEETLAWEKAQRARAGLLALVAGNLTLFGGIAASIVYKDVPKVPFLDGLRDAAGEPLTVGQGLRTSTLAFYDDKTVPLLIVAVVLAIGSAAMAAVLGYLFRATAARGGPLPRVALYGALVGPILVAVAGIAKQIGIAVKSHEFVTGNDFSTAAAHDHLGGGVILAGQILEQLGVLLVAFSFVLICLNAMRVGLLTRFMGVLGMIVGALFIIPLGSNLPIVQCFWLIAVGFLIMDRWPGPAGRPPAWTTGTAQPWPSQQELREAREAASGTAVAAPSGGSVAVDAPGEGAVGTIARRPDGTTQPASKKRKNRKRR